MARITVEDCANITEHKFELVILAAQRAKQIESGASPTIEKKNDKNTVVALREIALNNLDINLLRSSFAQKISGVSIENEEEIVDIDTAKDMSALFDKDTDMYSTDMIDDDIYFDEETESGYISINDFSDSEEGDFDELED